MAFGFGLRSDKSRRTAKAAQEVKMPPPQQQQQQQQQPEQQQHADFTTSENNRNRNNQPVDVAAQFAAQAAQVAQLTHATKQAQTQAAPSNTRHRQHTQHLRLDGDSVLHHHHRADRSASSAAPPNYDPRRRGELAGSLLETRSRPQLHVRPTRGMTTVASSFLDERAHAHSNGHSNAHSAHGLDRQQLQLQHQQQQERHRRRGMTTASQYSHQSARSTTSTSNHSTSDSSSDRVEAKVDILFKGHLMVKKGLLKGLEKRFYFLTRGSPELYCCKDETSFSLWYASGWSLNAGHAIAKGSGLSPMLVCSVLRADRAGDSGGSDRGIVLVVAPGSSSVKSASLKFYAESAEKCERWIKAFHKVQTAKRSPATTAEDNVDPPLSPSTAASSSGGSGVSSHHDRERDQRDQQDFVASPRHAQNMRTRHASRSRSDASQSSATSSGAPRAYAGGQLRTKSREDSQSVKSSSSSDISDAAMSHKSDPSVARANGLFNTTLSSNGTQGNVLLFVAAAGSAISVSDSKMALAKKQVAELVAKGAKRPTRGGMDTTNHHPANQSVTTISWRYGTPEYILSDLEYMKNKLREHDSTPLESYVEECCQTFLMEATHKAKYSDWISVRQEYFYLQVNDGERIPGHAIQENDMFGLLFVNDFEVTDVDMKEGEEKDPRAILSEAFTEGFPMEILEVYTQPPQCYFSWRHWGPFTGRYKGVKGDGSRVEIRGFGQMQIDSNRMLNLRLFFKTKDLFDELNKVSSALGEARARARDMAANPRSRAVSSAIPHFPVAATTSPSSTSPASALLSSSGASTSASGINGTTTPAAAPATTAPPPAPKSKATLTADIMDELANFTIASSKERGK